MELQKTNKRETGRTGEDIAVNYLKQKGYHIIERNYFKRCGEIDIIAKVNETIVFIEVKTLYNENFVKIYDTISVKKKLRLVKSAKIWLCKEHRQIDSEFRIDFLGILFEGIRIKRLLHIKNAIY
jgi:putative endonuclease